MTSTFIPEEPPAAAFVEENIRSAPSHQNTVVAGISQFPVEQPRAATPAITTGSNTPATTELAVDVDHLAHFQKLNAALRLTPTPEDFAIPTEGRIENFGVVMSGVYRSAFPTKEGYSFLQQLKLKTVVTLVEKKEDHEYALFLAEHGIRHHVVDMKGTKKEAIPLDLMRHILRIVLNKANYPLLIHCNRGRHRTGCVVGIIRKLASWDLNHVLAEYRSYAYPKLRDVDVHYLANFDITHTPNYFHTAPFYTLYSAARDMASRPSGFTRMTIFVAFVLMLWLITLLTGRKVDVHFPEDLFNLSQAAPLPPAEEFS